jgi:hypothetical protein
VEPEIWNTDSGRRNFVVSLGEKVTVMREGLVAFAEGLRAACRFFVALWLAAFYGLIGDLEGFERWRHGLRGVAID